MTENREFDQQQDQQNQTPEQAQQFKDKPKTGEENEQDGNTQLQEDVETAGQERPPEEGEAQSGFVGSESESDRSDELINRDLDDQP